MKPFFVYMLKCEDESYYIGHTDDIEKRIAEHNKGNIKCYTQSRLPVKVVYIKDFATRDEALTVERQIKGWSRQKKDALIREEMKKIIKNRSIKPFDKLRANGVRHERSVYY